MKNEQNKYTWRLISGGVLLSCILLILVVVLPYVSSTLEKYQVYSSQKESLQLVGDWSEQLEQLNKKQIVLNESMESMYIGLPKEQEFSSVVASLFSIAQSSNISISKIKPSESVLVGNQLRKEFSLDIQAEYHNLARFINRIEQSDYLINLQEMRVENATENSPLLETEVSFEITMQTASK